MIMDLLFCVFLQVIDQCLQCRYGMEVRRVHQKIRDARPMLTECCASVCDAGPTFNQQWDHVMDSVMCDDEQQTSDVNDKVTPHSALP